VTKLTSTHTHEHIVIGTVLVLNRITHLVLHKHKISENIERRRGIGLNQHKRNFTLVKRSSRDSRRSKTETRSEQQEI
jgi:hypothetical protein